jgi:hypothetical protein
MVFLKHYIDANVKQLSDTKNISFYTRYVDDILVMYNATKTNPHTIITFINEIHNNIKLNPTYETHNSIHFLD